MPRGDYAPEIKKALGTGVPGRVNTTPPRESPADKQRDVRAGIKENSAQDQKLDAMPQNMRRPAASQAQTAPQAAQMPADAHHIAAATSIAHAILGSRGGGM
jgi:hypothetical protein